MVYIPKRQKTKRLSSRVGQSPGVAAAPSGAHTLDAVGRVLETVSNKLAPAILGYYKEEREEETRTKSLEFLNEVQSRFNNRPSDASFEWYEENIGSYHKEVSKSEWAQGSVWQKATNHFLKLENGFKRTEIPKRENKLLETKSKNIITEVTNGLNSVNISKPERVNYLIDDAYESLTSAYANKRARELGVEKLNLEQTQALLDKPDVTLAFNGLEKKIRASLMKNASSHIVKHGGTAANVANTLDNWDKSKSSPGNEYLSLLDEYDINRNEFSRKVDIELHSEERKENLRKKQTEDEERRDHNNTMRMHEGDLTQSVVDDNEEAYNRQRKLLIESWKESDPKNRSKTLPYYLLLTFKQARTKLKNGTDATEYVAHLKKMLNIPEEDQTYTVGGNKEEVDWTNDSSVLSYVAEKGVPTKHQARLARGLMGINSKKLFRYKSVVVGFINQVGTELERIKYHSKSMGSDSIPETLNAYGQVISTKKKTPFALMKINLKSAMNGLMTQLMNGRYNLNESSDNFIGHAISKVYKDQIHTPIKDIFLQGYKDEFKHRLVDTARFPWKGPLGKNLEHQFNKFVSGYSMPFIDKRDPKNKQSVAESNEAVDELFSAMVKVKDSEIDSDAKARMKAVIANLVLLKSVGSDLSQASQDIANSLRQPNQFVTKRSENK